jgi:serine phosphatase RsbU (regulator of sigma subunit)
MIVVVSDGVIEVNNSSSQMFGFDRFESVVQTGPNTSAAAMMDHLKREIGAFVGTAEPHDDLTLVIIRCVTKKATPLD